MSAFNKPGVRPRVTSQVTTTGTTTTALGASGFTRSPLSDLYLLSVSNLVTVEMFHEGKDPRNERYVELLRQTALLDQENVTEMLPWLRQDGYMRSAAILGAAEAAKALCDQHRYDGVEDMVDGVLQRADEPGEFIAYWFTIAGKAWPKRYRAVRRGVARAVTRLYSEFSYAKWDKAERDLRFADIIEIVHPAPKADWQSDLFRYILDRRHSRPGTVTENMRMTRAVKQWRSLAQSNPHDGRLLQPEFIKEAGLAWENILSALGSKVDKKVLWEAATHIMAPGALLKNLRNFDENGISDEAADRVAAILTNGDRVRGAKVFPYQFLAAYRAAPSLRWGHVLERGLSASLENVPELRGKTLVLVDRSPSMFPGHSQSTPGKGPVSVADQAALFGVSLAVKAQDVTLVEFGGTSRKINVPRGSSVLKVVDSFTPATGIPYTDIPAAVKANFGSQFDRVVIITDEQSRPGCLHSMERRGNYYYRGPEIKIDDLIPASVPVYVWNMAGYSASVLKTSGTNRHCFGGLSDASFNLVEALENRKNAPWPWKIKKVPAASRA